MHLTTLGAGWQITGWYLLFLLLLVVVMKSISLLLCRKGMGGERLMFFLAPSLAFPAWLKRPVMEDGTRKRLFGRAVFLLLTTTFYYSFLAPYLSALTWWQQAYVAVLPFWLLLETLQVVMQMIWPESKRLVPPVNIHPLASSTIADFWGRRWNRLFGDWLYQACFYPVRRNRALALVLPFTSSALIHEILVSLPYWIVYRESVFGWMCGYFGIQYLAIVVSRKWWKESPVTQRIICWLAVLGPAPLVLNPGTLLIFQLIR